MTRAPDDGDPAREQPTQREIGDIVDLLHRARASADDLDFEHPRGGDLTDVLTFDLDIALDHARGLTQDLTSDGASALARALARTLALAFDLDHPDQRKLVGDLERARRFAADLAVAMPTAAQPTPAMEPVTETRATKLPAAMLVRLAVWMLPAPHRLRYDEEFRAERAELGDRVGRRAQFWYALNLLIRCWQLRRALSRPTITTNAEFSQASDREEREVSTVAEADPGPWQDLLHTIEHVLDSAARTRHAQQLLGMVLVAAVIAIVCITVMIVFAGDWVDLAVGMAAVLSVATAVIRRR